MVGVIDGGSQMKRGRPPRALKDVLGRRCVVCGGRDWDIAVSHYEKGTVWVLRCVGCGHDKIGGSPIIKGSRRRFTLGECPRLEPKRQKTLTYSIAGG